MALPLRLLLTLFVLAAVFSCVFCDADANTSTPFRITSNSKNIIVWQKFGEWLMVTEDLADGRICYYRDPYMNRSLYLKEPKPGNWMPLGSAIKWLMYVDYVNGLYRLMAHDVDWHAYYIAYPSSLNHIGVGMSDIYCIFGQYRRDKVGDFYPVDLYKYNVKTGACALMCASVSDKSQFAHDGNLIVYRAYYGPGDIRIYGHYFDGMNEFAIATRDGIEPSVCGTLVAWAERNSGGFDIVAKDISTGEMRVIAHTKADPPCPEAGKGFIYWRDSRNLSASGIDIYGYDWKARREFLVTNAAGDQIRLRVCDDIVTWVTGPTNYQSLWGANIIPSVQVTDLKPVSITNDSVELRWTSVGSASNPPVNYELRMRTDTPIDESNWAGSIVVPGLPTPKASGQIESYIVSGLNKGYVYFALKVRLQNGNESIISNSPSAYISDNGDYRDANLGAYVSFSGSVIKSSNMTFFYCIKASGRGAVRVESTTGQTQVSNGDIVNVTGILSEDSDLCGPVLKNSSISKSAQTKIIRPVCMANKWLGGYDKRFGGVSQKYMASNLWSLVKCWGRVSNIVIDNGCKFNISDGSRFKNDGLISVKVISPFPPPVGLADNKLAIVEGICRVSRSGERQIEIINQNGITLY